MTRIKTFPVVECKACGRYVYYDPGAMCWACESVLEDDPTIVEVDDDRVWTRAAHKRAAHED